MNVCENEPRLQVSHGDSVLCRRRQHEEKKRDNEE